MAEQVLDARVLYLVLEVHTFGAPCLSCLPKSWSWVPENYSASCAMAIEELVRLLGLFRLLFAGLL